MGAQISVPLTIANTTVNGVYATVDALVDPAFSLDPGHCIGSGLVYYIPESSSCALNFNFIPTDASGVAHTGTTTVRLTQTVEFAEFQDFQLSFSGSGTESLVQVTPVSIDFGNTLVGQQVSVPVTITDTHSAGITFAGGGISGTFGASGNCGNGVGATGGYCRITYSFTPSVAGFVQGDTDFSVTATSPIRLGQNFPIHLQGTGITTLPAPNVDVWPVGIDFGAIQVGHEVTVPFMLENNSTSMVGYSGGGFNDSKGGTFVGVSGSVPGCSDVNLPSGVVCEVDYKFRPHLAQAYTDDTAVSFYILSGPHMSVPFAFSGTGTGSLTRVSPRSIDIGSVPFGKATSVQIDVTNTSEAPLTHFIGGGVNVPFSSSNACTTSLDVGSTCSITYNFLSPAAQSSLQAKYTATTSLAFTNSTGIEQVVTIQISAHAGDRVFGDGFGN